MSPGEKIVEHRNQKLTSPGFSMLRINALGFVSSREFLI